MSPITDYERQVDAQKRIDLVRRMTLAVGIIFLLLLPIVVFLNRMDAVLILLSILFFLAFNLCLLHLTRSSVVGGNFLTAILFLYVSISVYRHQGEWTALGIPVLFIPILSTILGKKKSGVFWLLALGGMIFCMYALRVSGHEFVFQADKKVSNFVLGIYVALITLLMLAVASLYENYKNERMGFIRTQTLTDELTGLQNRRGFIHLANRQMQRAKREKEYFGLIFMDLNKFKAINDQYGHEEGDKALITFAEVLKEAVRGTDTLARLGGDEFVIATNLKHADDAQTLTDRILEGLNKKQSQSEKPYPICFSHGIVTVGADETTSLEALMKRSDELMYKHKYQENR